MKNKTISLFVLIALMIFTTSCGILNAPKVIAPGITSEYETLITAYQNGRRAAANGSTCVALTFSEIQSQVTLYNSYLTADVAKTEAYRASLAEFGGKVSSAQDQYRNVSPNNLDLAELVENNATPAQMALNVDAYVSTFYEAPLERVDIEALTNTQRIVSEKYNMTFACVKDWNEAVFEYNLERNKISGDIVGRLAEYLGVKELPQELPYYQYEISALPSIQPLEIP